MSIARLFIKVFCIFFTGIIPHCMSCVLWTLWKEGFINVNLFNDRLRFLFGMLYVEQKNRPIEMTKFSPAGQGFPKYSAAQTWSLFRYLPLMLAPYIPASEKSWKLFLKLQEAVDIMCAPRLNRTILVQFEWLWSEFLIDYKKVFPSIPLKPKFHFASHFVTSVMHNGPANTYWAMHYERQNGSVKQPSHIMHNFKAPLKSLAYRHQCRAFYSLMSKAFLGNSVVVSKSVFYSLTELERFEWFKEIRASLIPLLKQCCLGLEIAEKVTINTTVFRQGSFVLLNANEDGGFNFGKIQLILRDDPSVPLLLSTVYSTTYFDYPSHSHCVTRILPTKRNICSINDLLDHHPLDGVNQQEKTFIRLKYFVFKKN